MMSHAGGDAVYKAWLFTCPRPYCSPAKIVSTPAANSTALRIIGLPPDGEESPRSTAPPGFPGSFGDFIATSAEQAPFGGIMNDIMVNELTAVLDELGGESGVGRTVRTSEDLSAAIREGFRHEALNALTSAGFSLQEIAGSLDLSLRSLQRRKSQGRLARYESDRLYRLARLVSLAVNFLGDRKTAIDWLKRPNHALGGVAPLAIIDTELGARQVENVLGRIGYGGVS